MRKEIFWNFIVTILTSMMSFIQNKYFVQYMGIETLGLMKLFTQLLQYLNIVELGLGGASAYALYKPLADKDYKKTSIIVTTIEKMYNKIAILIFSLGILTIPLVCSLIESDISSISISIYWMLYILNTVSTYLYIKYVILFTANQELLLVRFIQGGSKFIFQILQVIFIIRFHSFYIFIILLFLDNITQFIFFKKYYKRKYSYIKETEERYDDIKTDIKNLFWHKIGWLVVCNTNIIFISKFVSLAIAGIYASYLMVIQILITLIGVITTVIRPKIGRFIAQNTKAKIYTSYKQSNILFIFGSLFSLFSLYILVDSFISLWIGKDFLLPKQTILLICINYFFDFVRRNLDIYKECFGFFDDIMSPILESIINLSFSIFLGKLYGVNGIVLGGIISNISIITIYKPILVFKRCFDQNWKEYIKVYGNYFVLVGISLTSLNIVTRPFIKVDINTWLEWIIYTITISIISVIIIFIVFLLNKDFRNIIKVYVLKKK